MFMLKSTHDNYMQAKDLIIATKKQSIADLKTRLSNAEASLASEKSFRLTTSQRATDAEAKISALRARIAELESSGRKAMKATLAPKAKSPQDQRIEKILNTKNESTPGVARKAKPTDLVAKVPVKGKVEAKTGKVSK